ncbi:MAG TPA: penicillin-binding transpeptidase domain-containing protein [Candidatus Brocadiia bacterium]|nr:penicillin-binding transpeptidase domain-containing protein [Candidatus Brocadiia bacterium]
MEFSRFDAILLGIAALFMVLIVRLGMVQLSMGERFADRFRSTTLVQNRLETRRGTIYARDGTPLARDESYFTIKVNYPNLLYASLVQTRQWPQRLSSMREHKEVGPPAPDGSNCAQCHRPGGGTYRSRRKLREFKGRCLECHSPDTAWDRVIPELTKVPREELLAAAARRIEKVERMWQTVNKRTSLPNLRIGEQDESYPIVDHVQFEKVAVLEENLDMLPGVEVQQETERICPDGALAPHVLGYMGAIPEGEWKPKELPAFEGWIKTRRDAESDDTYIPGDKRGVIGLEGYYESILRGGRGWVREEKSLDDLNVQNVLFEIPPVHGADIRISLDPVIQRAAMVAMDKARTSDTNVQRGAFVLMDCRNGEVIAMVSVPSYNTNTLRQEYTKLAEHPHAPLFNRAIQAGMPPGSSFKMVVAAAGLESGVITTETAFLCGGAKDVQHTTLRCNARWGHGPQSVVQAIENSCNVFFFDVGEMLGQQKGYEFLPEYARRFGFASPTNIDLLAENAGRMPVPASKLDLMNMAIGQGRVEVSPLQVTCMTAALANGGTVPTPHFLIEVTDAGGSRRQRYQPPMAERKVGLSDETMAAIKEGMRRVPVTGTARSTGLARYRVAAKTGTAELSRGGDINHAWLTGYFPYDNPRYAITVVAERVKGHGGEVAGPIAEEMIEKTWERLQNLP